MRRRDFLFLCLVVGAAPAGCSKTDTPVDPIWGKEPCAHCAMLVGDRRYSGQVVAHGERRYFDDIGCMALWLDAHGGQAEKLWVREVSGTWVDAKTARFATGAKTPMDFGFEPSGNGEISWDELVRRSLAKAKGGAR